MSIHSPGIHPPGRTIRVATAILAALLVAGLFSAAHPAPAGAAVPGAFTKTKAMATARADHAAVKLNDGRVLVTGGGDYNGTRSAELFTPSTKSWSAAASMKDIRTLHTATVLADGRVLVVGGYNSGALGTAELYNPATNTWTRTGSLTYARYDHTATLLADGKVLVTGGYGDGSALGTSELYDPSTGTFGSIAYLNYDRAQHVAARVSGKKVLVAGTDAYCCGSNSTVPRTAEVYNESSNSWTLVGQMGVGRRYGATATVLADGRVLISGGQTTSYAATSAAELFNPSTNSFSFTGDLNNARYNHEATRLNDGRVLVTGGYGSEGSAEIFSPASGEWQLTGSLLEDRSRHTATPLSGGKVLVAGGYGDAGELDSAEIFNPSASSIQDDKITPKVAWSGSVALVVWQDGRNGNADIYGTRLDANGNRLDGSGFAISKAAGEQTAPTVAWNGTNFLVAWADRRSGTDTNIYSTRVSTSGVVTNPNGKVVSSAANDQSFPVARANSSGQWLVVWQDGRSGSSTDVYGSRIAKNGTVSDPSGIKISAAVRDQRRPTVASSGTTWFVAWGDRRPANGSSDIYGTRVTTTGSVTNPSGVAISTAAADQSNPQVAWNGTTFLVVWSDYRSGSSLDVYGSRVNASGTTLNAGGIAISKVKGVTEAPSSVSAIGHTFLVAWQDDRGGTFDIYGSRVSDTGTVANLNGVKINSSAGDQAAPAVGVAGNQFLVAWGDTRSGGNSDIYATRVSTSGVVQSTSGFVVAS
jgi:N-acetylneuraminic acid mutarotase